MGLRSRSLGIDDELAAAGVRRRDGLDAEPSAGEGFAATRSSRRRSPIVSMLAGAALIIAVGITVALLATSNDGPAAVGGPGVPDQRSPCSDNFAATLTPTPVDVPRGAASTAEIRLRYPGPTTCWFDLDITAVDLIREGEPAVEVYNTNRQIGFGPIPVPIAPGGEYDTTLTWSSYCDNAPVTAFRLHLGEGGRVIDVPTGRLATPGCAPASSTPLLVTGVMPTQDAATLRIGIRHIGGPAPGNSPDLFAGTVVVSLGTDPYRTAVVTAGQRTTVVVAANGTASYRVTGTSGDAHCLPQSITPAAGTATDVTVLCSVR